MAEWRKAVAGDLVQLTGAGMSGGRFGLYKGKVVRATDLTTPGELWFETVPGDPAAPTRGVAEQTFVNNEKSRFALVDEGRCFECGKRVTPAGVCINVFCATAQRQATG